MRSLKWNLIIGFLAVSVVETLWHFLYEWTGENRLIGFIAPINESTFEHMKLIFFPALFYLPISKYFLQEEYPSITDALSCGILSGTLFLPVFFYTYSGILGKNLMAVDIASFYLCVMLVFLISYRKVNKKKQVSPIWFYLLFVMIFLFVWFTYRNSGLGIFLDPAVNILKT